jgi:D-aminopeptidase
MPEGTAPLQSACEKSGLAPFRPAPPHRLEIELANAACADAAELVPGTTRLDGVTVGYEAPDAAAMIRIIQAWTILAASTLV